MSHSDIWHPKRSDYTNLNIGYCRQWQVHSLFNGKRTHTTYFVIIWSLRPRAAALHYVLPSTLHDSIKVREISRKVLQHMYKSIQWKPQTERVLHYTRARHFYRSFVTVKNVQWIHPVQNIPENGRTDPWLTRGSDDGQLALKLVSQEEVTGLLQVLSTCNDNIHIFMWRIENVFLFFLTSAEIYICPFSSCGY